MDALQLFLTLAIPVFALIVGLLARRFALRGAKAMPYERVERLSRPIEPSFPGLLLERVLGAEYYILSKVNLANVIQPREDLSHKAYTAALECVIDKQVDFAVCNLRSSEIVGVIEVDNARYGHKPRKRRNAFLAAALSAAGIPLAHVRARKAYALEDVRREIMAALVPVAG